MFMGWIITYLPPPFGYTFSMKNIYITDLDHTFLRNDLSVSEYTKNIWNAKQKTALMGVATARTFRKSMQFLGGVELSLPLILLDGALVATRERKIIDAKFIDQESADLIIAEGAKFGVFPFVLALEDANLNEAFLHSETLNAYQAELITRYIKEDNLQPQKNLRAPKDNFKIVYMGDKEVLEALYKHVHAIFGERFKYIFAPEAYLDCYFFTVLHKDADKAHGIRTVQEFGDFSYDRLTVFGDNLNDVGMFELSRTAVAVANAQKELKEKATIVLPHTNDEDAVARYLEALL